jgi:PadR family transcriptional regulator PadR
MPCACGTQALRPGRGSQSLTYTAVPSTLYRMVAAGQQEALLAQMRRGTLQHCVLALLAEEERYGFDLVRALAAVDGMVTSEGTIYPLLSRLRREGLVESTWQESVAGPPRRYYRLTDAGRAALEGFRLEWSRFREAVDHFVERTVRS